MASSLACVAMLNSNFRINVYDVITCNVLIIQVQLMGNKAWIAFAAELSTKIIQVWSEFVIILGSLLHYVF